MDLLSTDPDRPGIFAVGQLAQGVFALGQMATGVVAVGQLARGVVAVGQGAVGIVAVGQGAIGVLYGIGMVGVVGRGKGLVLQVLPEVKIIRPTAPAVPDELRPIASLVSENDQAWVDVRIEKGALRADGNVSLALAPEAQAQLDDAARNGHDRAYAHVTTQREVDRDASAYREAPESHVVRRVERLVSWSTKTQFRFPNLSAVSLVLRAIGLAVTCAAWWYLAGASIVGMFR